MENNAVDERGSVGGASCRAAADAVDELRSRVTGARPRETRVCPIDLMRLDDVPATSAATIRQAVTQARRASLQWSERSFADRVSVLRAAAKTMLRDKATIIELVCQEIGKLEVEGEFNEALGHLDVLDAWISVIERGLSRKVRLNPLKFPGKSALVDMVPRGVIGIIAPWNFPVAGLYRSVYPALLTGNGIVVKPSEHAPRSADWFLGHLTAALPEGLISVVHGAGEVGELLIDSGIDACVFTGSSATGRKVRVRCAEHGIPASVEMGGKDAAIVLADCDLARTAAGITHWALSNVGQACGAVEIALVEDAIADRFMSLMADAWRRLRVGPTEKHAELSSIAHRGQLEVVQCHVDEAVAAGAKVLCGGAPTGQGLFYPPTLLDHCTEAMSVVRDETFGPVLAVVRVPSAAEAVRVVNRGRYGLGASIWTRDIARAKRLARQLDVGVVDVNNHAFTGAISSLPWSGTRNTGYSVANGPESLLTFTRPRTIVVDRSRRPEPFWMPFDADMAEISALLIDAQLMRLKQAWRLPMLMRRRVATVRKFFANGQRRAE